MAASHTSASDAGEKDIQPGCRALLGLATPVILLNLTFVAIQITDTWLVGRLGSRELAAITPPSMAIFAVVSFGYAFLSVVTTYVAQCLGSGDCRSCGRFAWIGIYSALAIGLASLLLWPLGTLFELGGGSDPGSLGNLESRYFRICLLAMPPVLVTNAIANFYFGTRRPTSALVLSVFGFAVNALLSYALITGNLGLPKLGFDGAAWGTVISTSLEGLAFLVWFLLDPGNRRFATSPPRRTLNGIRDLWKVGLPAGFQGAIDVLSWGVLLSILIAAHGEAALAAGTILMRCMQFTFLPAEGVATIVIALVGNSVGAGRPEDARAHTAVALKMNATFMVAAGILLYLFRDAISSAFTTDPEVISIVGTCMIFLTLAQWFDAMNITYIHALQGAGDTRWPSLVTLALSCTILGVGGLASVTWLHSTGPVAIWILAFVYVAAQGILFRSRWRSGKWERINLAI